MFDRAGRDAFGRLGSGARAQAKAGRRLQIEPLEGRAMMTASIAPIATIASPQFQGYQVPLIGQTTHAQTYTVTSDNPSVKATIARGQFLTFGVSHASSGAGDPAVAGTMTFQLFDDLTPLTTSKIESLVNGTATGLSSQARPNVNYYVGKVIHRIANGFPGTNDYIVQGGSVTGNGTGAAFAAPFPDEFLQQLAFTGNGQLAEANSGPDTNDAQFFITTASPTGLNYHHTVFGQIVAGQDILSQLTQVRKGTDGTTPSSPVTITSATLSPVSPNGVVHVDTTVAPANATANLTVTATDVVDKTTATQTFQVNVTPTTTANPSRPFLGPLDPNISIGAGQVAQIQLTGIATPPGDPLTYTVQGGTTSTTTNGTPTTTFTAVQNARATVSATGLVTVTPNAGYTGPITLLVGVRDQTNRAGSGVALESPGNYQTHVITVNVAASTAPVPLRPIAQQAVVAATTVGSTPIQLFGSNPNATETLPLTFAVASQPSHGTITGLDATTGRLNYTPTPGYTGPDAFTYTVNDPTSGLSSFATPININITLASTGTVRFFANDQTTSTTVPGVLTVTPLPRTDGGTNTVNVTQANGNIQVTVNGVVDILQPAATNVDRIVVYGSKANDNITVDPSVTTLVTLDGGRFGAKTLRAGGGPTREHGWYGTNTLVQGSSNNYQLGRQGKVTFVKGTGTSDVIFAGTPGHFNGHSKIRIEPTPPHGTFFTFRGTKLVKTADPYLTTNAAGKKSATTTTTTRFTGTGQTVTTRAVKATTPAATTTPTRKK